MKIILKESYLKSIIYLQATGIGLVVVWRLWRNKIDISVGFKQFVIAVDSYAAMNTL